MKISLVAKNVKNAPCRPVATGANYAQLLLVSYSSGHLRGRPQMKTEGRDGWWSKLSIGPSDSE